MVLSGDANGAAARVFELLDAAPDDGNDGVGQGQFPLVRANVRAELELRGVAFEYAKRRKKILTSVSLHVAAFFTHLSSGDSRFFVCKAQSPF